METNNRAFIIFIVILSFVTGIVGGVGGIALISNSDFLKTSLNISGNVPLPNSTKIENISVKEDSAVVDSVKKVQQAVVSVVFTKDVNLPNFFGFETPTQTQQGGGSGFILTSDGLIATNKHVANIDGAQYTVIAQDGKKYDAKVVSVDPVTDFAILKIDAKNLPVVDFGDSDSLDIGQRVIAIGNALGEFQNSVTVGVVSGKERSLTASDASGSASETLDGLLQTDAAINSGNSGGPLVNLRGQVVGINTATAAKGQAEGLGFAIPINSIKPAIDSVKKTGKITRAYLGVRYTPVDQKIAAIKGMKDARGVLVIGSGNMAAVEKDSPADKAGIKEGDIILKINNDDINENTPLRSVLGKYSPDQEISLTVLKDGKEENVKIKLGKISV